MNGKMIMKLKTVGSKEQKQHQSPDLRKLCAGFKKKKGKIPILAVANNKGGEGKSYFAALLVAGALHFTDLKILFIDFDTQGNASLKILEHLFQLNNQIVPDKFEPPMHPEYEEYRNSYDGPADEMWDGVSSSGHIYFDDPTKHINTYGTQYDNLEILPASESLLHYVLNNRDKLEMSQDEAIDIPSQIFTQEALKSMGIDMVIIDTPPAMQYVSKGAIKCATHVVVPVQFDTTSIQGIGGVISTIEELNDQKSRQDETKILGIYPNRVYKPGENMGQDQVKESFKRSHLGKKYLVNDKLHVRNSNHVTEYNKPSVSITSVFEGYPVNSLIHKNAFNFVNDVFNKVFDGEIN
jgi:cellulose biosynthesis protein BcsQ